MKYEGNMLSQEDLELLEEANRSDLDPQDYYLFNTSLEEYEADMLKHFFPT